MKIKDILTSTIAKVIVIVLIAGVIAGTWLYLFPPKELPNTAEGWNRLACEEYQHHEYDKASQAWDRAVIINPDNPDYYWRRARACHHINRFDQAIDDSTKAIQLGANGNPRKLLYYYYTRAVNKAARGDNSGGIEDLTEAIKMAKADYDAAPMYMERGRIYLDLFEPKKAVKDLTRAIEIVPTWGRAYYYRSKAYEALEENDLSVKDLQASVNMNYIAVEDNYEPLPIR